MIMSIDFTQTLPGKAPERILISPEEKIRFWNRSAENMSDR